MKFTILGSKGFIGSNIENYLKKLGHECYTPEIRNHDLSGESLGHVIFAIGVPNFKERPFDAVEGHVCALKKILEKCRYESLVYFSGTRVYSRMSSTNEDEPVLINSLEYNNLYEISKLMGESLCIATKNPNVKIVRLSNVTGFNPNSNLFLPSIIKEAVQTNKIKIFTSLKSEKDYIYINDVNSLIYEILINGKDKIYNVASGQNIKSQQLLEKIKSITNCSIEISPNAPEYSFPVILIDKIKKEFNFKPTNIIDKIDEIVESYRKFKK
jgi:nucleoside-diphosphate-sugar epimerase